MSRLGLGLDIIHHIYISAFSALLVPRTRLSLELGKGAFAVAAPAAWNNLPMTMFGIGARQQ